MYPSTKYVDIVFQKPFLNLAPVFSFWSHFASCDLLQWAWFLLFMRSWDLLWLNLFLKKKNLRIITFYALDLLFTATAVRVSEEKISLQAIFAIFAIFSPSLVCSICYKVCSPSPDARKEESSTDQDQKNHFFSGKPHSWYSPPLVTSFFSYLSAFSSIFFQYLEIIFLLWKSNYSS